MVESCAQSLPFEFSEKFKFWPHSKINVAPVCGKVEMFFSNISKSTFYSKEWWNRHQNWPRNGNNIAVWMTKVNRWCVNTLFKFNNRSVTNKKTPKFSFSRRRAAADLHQTLQVHRVQKKVIYFVFEHNFTTTGWIFLQFSVTITE